MLKYAKIAVAALIYPLLMSLAFAQNSESILSLSVDIKGPENNQASIITPVKVVQSQDKQVSILQPQNMEINFVEVRDDGIGGVILKIKPKYMLDKKDVTATVRLHAKDSSSLEVSGSTDIEKVSLVSNATNTQRIELPETSLTSLPVKLSINENKQIDTQVLTFNANNLAQELRVTITISKLL